jgi:type II secretory pathway component GspD/PulD (secretin)
MFVLMFRLTLAFFCWAAAAHAQTALEQVNLKHQTPQAIAERLKPLLADGEYVVPARNEVLINAVPAKLAQYRELIARWDVQQRQWLLEVRQGDATALAQSGLAAQGNVTMTSRGASGIVTIAGGSAQTSSNRMLTQSLRVIDGAQARITLANSVPLTLLSITHLPDGAAFVRTTAVMVEAQSGITATVTALPQDGIAEVQLAPRLAQLHSVNSVSPGSSVTTQAAASTTVQLKAGDWVTVAESVQQASRNGTQEAGRYLVQIRLSAASNP